MTLRRKRIRIGDILLQRNVLTPEQLIQALEIQAEGNEKIGEILVDEGFTTEEKILEALHQQLGLPIIRLTGMDIPKEVVELVNVDILKKYIVFPYERDAANPNILHIAMADPMDLTAVDDISIVTGLRVEPALASQREIMGTLDRYFGNSETMGAARRFTEERQAMLQADNDEADKTAVEDAPIVQLVRALIEQAARQRASDIHIEALEKKVRVRYRIDGSLYERMIYDNKLLSALLSRIKILSGMDISEKRKPQDGRMSIIVDRKEYDIRVSSLPTVYGEKVVMRLSSTSGLTKNKKELGLYQTAMERFDRMLASPFGIILVTGPTGSGKSTTLYTALSELNREDVNIVTVEDPVEANLDGINQVQVNPKAELTFAAALRSILRQDPDIIMIGEIRDEETAQIAVQASITGHLVVSTLHTNNAVGALDRMADMGVERYLIADAVVGVIAQRLVRRLCPHCKKPRPATEQEKLILKAEPGKEQMLYEPVGCELCNHTGYYGRIGIFEIMEVTDNMRHLISSNSGVEELLAEAKESGMQTLRDNGASRVVEGVTSFAEMMKISYE